MASRKYHCKESLTTFGEEFDHVHKWLDGEACVIFEGTAYLDMNHRWKRHHKEGVEEVRKMWGDEAALAAVQHIITDMGKVYTKAEMIKQDGKKPQLIRWKDIFGEERNE